jgi:hypothetical protein
MQANGLAVDEEMRVEPTTVENIRYEELDESIGKDIEGTSNTLKQSIESENL